MAAAATTKAAEGSPEGRVQFGKATESQHDSSARKKGEEKRGRLFLKLAKSLT